MSQDNEAFVLIKDNQNEAERPVSEPQKIGIVTVSMQVLADLLHFPEGHKIVGVRQRPADFASDAFQILCEGPTLPVTSASEYTPEVRYTCTQTEDATKLVPERKIEGKFST
jgi:hypothetical protein